MFPWAGQTAADTPGPDLDRVFASPPLFGSAPSSLAWSADGQWLAFLWAPPGESARGLWLVGRDGSGLRRVDEVLGDAASVRALAWSPTSDVLYSLRGDALWQHPLEGVSRQLASTQGGASTLAVSPDGRFLSWLREGDLWLLELGSESARRATEVGIPSISDVPMGRYRRPDREIGPGIWGGPTYAWSPDSRHIAVHHVDRRGLPRVAFPDYLAAGDTDPNRVRRGYPGDANEARTVGFYSLESGELSLLPLDDPGANQVVHFSWSPQGVLLLDAASDTAVDRWLYTVTPAEPQLREVWHERRESRIYTQFASDWSADGQRILVLSDRDDRYGLYALDPQRPGVVATRLSDPEHDVLGAPAVSDGAVFYPANHPRPESRQVFRVSADGAREQVTTRPGHNDALPSPDGGAIAVIHSADDSPPELYVGELADDDLQRVTRSPTPAFADATWVRGRYVNFPSRIDGYTLRARILEPVELEPRRRYPVLFGPVYSNTVRDRWAGIYSAMQQYLVQQGYIVVQVDVRGSTGYGRDFREEFLTDFAGEDLDDIESAVDYLRTLPQVDPERLGIWGSSYGGTLSIYTLLKKPGLFCAAVAAASAVDPAYFGPDDVAIVRRPTDAPEIFARRAADLAANLEDHLLLIHGLQDQVVPFRTVAVLMEALMREGKNFDVALAPGATHGWSREAPYGRFLFGKLVEFFDRHLKSGDCAQ
jgi:dipeptidyl-peptidase-4